MVFQHFSLFNALSVYENIAIGLDNNFLENDLKSRVIELSRKYGLPLNPDDIVGNLSAQISQCQVERCSLIYSQLTGLHKNALAYIARIARS